MEKKNTVIEIKDNLQGYNSREDEAENQNNDLEYKEEKKPPQRTTRRKRIPKNEDSIGLWDNFKRSNICIIRVPEGEEKEIRNPFEKNNERKLP